MPGNLNHLRDLILAQAVTPREAERAGQIYRGDMPREYYAPPFGEGKSYGLSPREVENKRRDSWLYKNSPNATPEDLREFGLNPQGQRMDGKSFTAPFSQGDMWKELEQLTPSAIRQLQKHQQLQELGRALQQQHQQQSQPRSYTRPFEAPTQNQLNNYEQNHPMNRMWNELKNYR